MVERVRHQLFLPKPVSDRLEALGRRPGTSKSAILADAVTAWLNRRATSEIDEHFGARLERLSMALSRIERDDHIILETLALFIRFELSIQIPLAETDHAGRAMGRERFEAFVTQVGRQIAAGRRTLGSSEEDR